MIRIVIADDHSIVRKGLRQILLEEFESATITEVSSGEELLMKVMKDEWDIVISDLSMPGRNGLDILQQIKSIYPKLPVLILSVHSEEHYALRALKAGASGYLNKDLAPEELIKAVHRVLSGKKYITPAVAEKLASEYNPDSGKLSHEHLSDREFEVLKLLAAGKSISEIANLLSLSSTTISTYRSRIMIKMNIKNNAELILYASRNNLL